jgi:hypothetical protein
MSKQRQCTVETALEKRKKLAYGPAVREKKRQKWQTKQELFQHRIQSLTATMPPQEKDQLLSWCLDHSTFVTLVTEQDVLDILNHNMGSASTDAQVESDSVHHTSIVNTDLASHLAHT